MPKPRIRVGRIVRSADFERVLARPPCSRSAHFAAHRYAALADSPQSQDFELAANKLSTEASPTLLHPVDDSLAVGLWLGCVVPKRHARRAVTRNLIKRAMRAALDRRAPDLAPGLWVLRLRAAFARNHFPSAASPALRVAVTGELDRLVEDCVRAASSPVPAGTTP